MTYQQDRDRAITDPAETYQAGGVEVIDATPKPKIPEEDIYLLVHLIAGSHFVEIGILKSIHSERLGGDEDEGIVDRG